MIQWSLGQDAPRSVAAIGGKYALQDNRDILVVNWYLRISWRREDQFLPILRQRRSHCSKL